MAPESAPIRWCEQLSALAAEASEGSGFERTWSELVDESSATLTALSGWSALLQHQRRQRPDRDDAALAVDVVIAPLAVDTDPLREDFLEALARVSESTYAGIDLDELVDRLESFREPQIRGLISAVQGTVMELRVRDSFLDGTFDLPEGAAGGVIADRNAMGLDGYFYDENQEIIAPFQVKATQGLGPVKTHLERHPEVETVLTNVEAAELAEAAGIDGVIDTGHELADVIRPGPTEFIAEFETDAFEAATEIVTSAIPLATFAMLGAELTWAAARGQDTDAKLEQLKGRGTRAMVLSSAAYAVSAATGFEPARLVLVGGTFAAKKASNRFEVETEHSVDQVRGVRRLVATIEADVDR